ncbi:MAG: hypothetical protein QNJ55_32040 [Xenococcus sp. MO_188.B8]|nr:hypothetical protein [Xenococcus sp. MO_188.B8]
MMKPVKYLITFIASLILTGCADSKTWNCVLPSSQNQNSVQSSDQITPIIQIDGTLSMQGFVKIPDSQYIQTLQLIDRVANRAFSKSPQYYKLGLEKEKLAQETSSQKAQRQEFYTLQDALLEKALIPLDEDSSNELSIIITDLYREDSDITPVIQGFKNYLSQGYAVGLLPIKSQFNGFVYDTFVTRIKFLHQKPRPFYVIFLGKHENIISYFEQLKKSNSNFIDLNNSLVFSLNNIKQIAHFNINKDFKRFSSGVERAKEIFNQDLQLKLINENHVERLVIEEKQIEHKQPFKYSYSNSNEIEYHSLPYTLPIKTNLQVKSCLYDKKNKNIQDDKNTKDSQKFLRCPKEKLKTSPNQSHFIKFSDFDIDRDKMTFLTEYINSNLNDRIETVVVDVFPSEITLPSWIDDWSFEEHDKNQTNDFYGSRTYNLRQLLLDLSAATNNELNKSKEQSLIGRFCFVVHKR